MKRRPRPSAINDRHADWIDAPGDDLPERDIRDDVEAIEEAEAPDEATLPDEPKIEPLCPVAVAPIVAPIETSEGVRLELPIAKKRGRPKGSRNKPKAPPAIIPTPEPLAVDEEPSSSALVIQRRATGSSQVPRGQRWRTRRLPDAVVLRRREKATPAATFALEIAPPRAKGSQAERVSKAGLVRRVTWRRDR